MIVTSSAEAVGRRVRAARARGLRIGFVPTMGSFHEGHLSLMRRALGERLYTVVSVFVNPLQFAPREDLARYPRNVSRDRALARTEGVHLFFAPREAAFYPPGFRTRVRVEGLGDVLDGRSRPGHFEGVATVVARLLHLVEPDVLFLGRKDFQQTVVLRRMIRDLGMPVRVDVRPTVRERDGLALSSRNAYLTPSARNEAPRLHRALMEAKVAIRSGERSAARVRRSIRARLGAPPALSVEYVEIVDAETLEPVRRLAGRVVLLLAVRLGRARLIDNEPVRVP
jgi:pantoate--beta-alanine ligase